MARADWRWAQWAWSAPRPPGARAGPGAAPATGTGSGTPADALRGIAEPARLAAAAAALGPAFPELAEVLRQAAGRPRTGPGGLTVRLFTALWVPPAAAAALRAVTTADRSRPAGARSTRRPGT